jgi:hypothetical protein
MDAASPSEFSSSDSGFVRFLVFGAAFTGFASVDCLVALGLGLDLGAAAFFAGAFAF